VTSTLIKEKPRDEVDGTEHDLDIGLCDRYSVGGDPANSLFRRDVFSECLAASRLADVVSDVLTT
jgi:hypothetical protein